jgi:hypothetical protein
MSRTISETIMAERRQPIEFAGRLVYSQWPLEVHEGQILLLRLQCNRQEIKQAIGLKIDHGKIEVDGDEEKHFRLWCEAAPPQITVVCHPGNRRKHATLWFWNHWEDEDGIVQAGLNNAGIVVEERTPTRTVLGCSPGLWSDEPPDFTALRVEILTGSDATGAPPEQARAS